MATRLASFFVSALSVSVYAASPGEGNVKWRFDSESHVWASPETGITLGRSIAGFTQKSAEPYDKDGSAFGYEGKHAGLTLIIERRVAGGYPGTGDCTPDVRANYLREMHERYGKTDSERSFAFVYSSGSKSGRGVGTVCHFISFPSFGDRPAYSEVGVVLIGEILLEYRYSFFNTDAVADLDGFLGALGMKKIGASAPSFEKIGERLFRDPEFQLYAVIFGVTVDSHSKVQSLRVAEVSDSKHDKSAVRVRIPSSFIAAVRERVEQEHHSTKLQNGKPVEFFIYYWYSPTYPKLLISDWEKPAEEQP